MTDMHREGFESWVSGQSWFKATIGLCPSRSGHDYEDLCINSRWQGWIAALRYRDEQKQCECAYTCKFCRDEQEKQA